jgi:hypothetical protein
MTIRLAQTWKPSTTAVVGSGVHVSESAEKIASIRLVRGSPPLPLRKDLKKSAAGLRKHAASTAAGMY